ncbi:MAG TPA: phosphate signaling complex protein PhoU [Steroidobacteraceae bacterium]|nr:phosphate signaling complex protein PhoU [Steroidobacteraceae bacterium]
MTELTEGHTVRQFDGDLANLRVMVLEMGGLVLDQAEKAVRAILEGNSELATTVVERDAEVDRYDERVDEESYRVLVRRQPVATDLRAVIAIGKSVADLERAGDEARKIARYALSLGSDTSPRPAPEIVYDVRRMAETALPMLRQAIECFDDLDAVAATALIDQDDEVDAEFRAATRRLLTLVLEDGRNMRHAIEAMFIVKALERIGDHAKNIAAHVSYLVHGRDVRHAHGLELHRSID